MSTRKTLEQERASDAWDKINRVNKDEKKYGSLARGLPAMLQTNGLGQTLAFLKAKGKGDSDDYHTVLYNHIGQWLNYRIVNVTGTEASDFLGWLVRQRSDTYRQATTEAIAYSLWLRRFAEAQGWADEEGESQ